MNEDTKKTDGSRLDWIDQVKVERFEMKRGLLLVLPALSRIM